MLRKTHGANLWFLQQWDTGDTSTGKQISNFAAHWAVCSTAELLFLIPDLSPCALMLAECTVDLRYCMKYKNEADWKRSNSWCKLLKELAKGNGLDFSYKHLTILSNSLKNLIQVLGKKGKTSIKVTLTVMLISTAEQCACGRLSLYLSLWDM